VDLTVIWAGIIGLAVFAYVVMDGFDLGIGILFPGLSAGIERDKAMNAIAPVWDGNETWLVMGGGGLFAAFPLAYAILLSATYPPIIAMLLGLAFRGVAFKFRWRDPRRRAGWDIAFSLGSFIAALCQGIVLGAVLQGVKVEKEVYAGGWLDLLSPFTLLTGASVVVGYALLGATWLVWRTEGSCQARARRSALWLAAPTSLALAAVSAATPFFAFEAASFGDLGCVHVP
jgi:cytochrome d ubiquinol oxidase subunit II